MPAMDLRYMAANVMWWSTCRATGVKVSGADPVCWITSLQATNFHTACVCRLPHT